MNHETHRETLMYLLRNLLVGFFFVFTCLLVHLKVGFEPTGIPERPTLPALKAFKLKESRWESED